MPFGAESLQQLDEFAVAMPLGGLQGGEIVQLRNDAGVGPVREQIVRDFQVPLDQAGNQRRSHDLRVLVIGVHTLDDVILHQRQIAIDCGLIQILPIAC